LIADLALQAVDSANVPPPETIENAPQLEIAFHY